MDILLEEIIFFQQLNTSTHRQNTASKKCSACFYSNNSKTFFDNVELAKNYYIEKVYKKEDVEKKNDEYILHQLDFMFANYGQVNGR